MSTHPNAILLLVLTPDDSSRKTLRAIVVENNPPKVRDDDNSVSIGSEDYILKLMEEDYDDSYQIKAKEGDIVVFDMITYGYGERIEWDKLIKQQSELKAWADGVCERHKCTAKFYITANHW